MATLILTAVGTAVGGPIGGAIGAVLGQAADARLFSPRRREGPRLGELSVQTSSYGTQIPRLFGTMRVAGTIIWATDLREDRTTSGGGKGSPATTSYAYSASFAVALSGRPIRAVRRIWADGKLLRGAAGDFKSRTGFRLYTGGEAQAPDPLIAAAEGMASAPAFRGIAYALFEDFQLGDYGNRIPSLTFEVEADDGPVTLGMIAETISGGAVLGGETPAVIGYAASGDGVRGALAALTDLMPLSLSDTDTGLKLSAGEPLDRAVGDDPVARPEISRGAMSDLPDEVSLAYHDPARDYQVGLQRARRDGSARRIDRRAVPAVLAAAGAKALAETRLAAILTERVHARLALAWSDMDVRPGAVVRLAGEGGRWRCVRWRLERGQVLLDLVRAAAGARPAEPATPGRPVSEPDAPHGPTLLRVHDLPLAGEGMAVVALAAGAMPAWRRAALEWRLEGGAWTAAGATAGPAVMGTARTALGPAGSALFDRRNRVEVALEHSGMWLESRDDHALIGGANLALIGEEMVQFGDAEPLGEGRFRLSRLLRGRRGTEWAAERHAAGEGFVLIDESALSRLPVPAGGIGAMVQVQARGLGDIVPAAAFCVVSGEALRPPSPVHVRARVAADGVHLTWTRRSRLGWTWASGAETPLGEEREAYRVTVMGAGGLWEMESSQPACLYPAARRAADGNDGPLTIEISQIGTYAASRAVRLVLDLGI